MNNFEIKLLEEHIKDVERDLINAGLHPEKGLGREFINQTRHVIHQSSKMVELSLKIKALEKKVAALEGPVQEQHDKSHIYDLLLSTDYKARILFGLLHSVEFFFIILLIISNVFFR